MILEKEQVIDVVRQILLNPKFEIVDKENFETEWERFISQRMKLYPPEDTQPFKDSENYLKDKESSILNLINDPSEKETVKNTLKDIEDIFLNMMLDTNRYLFEKAIAEGFLLNYYILSSIFNDNGFK
jgi:glycerol-3-phosphate O-acyltransferase